MNLRDVIQSPPRKRPSIAGDFVGILALMIPMGALLLALGWGASCSASQKSAEHAAFVCTEDAAIKALEPTVASILTNGAPDGTAGWEAQLVALAAAFGGDEIDCAVTFAKSLLASKPGVVNGLSPVQRADQYLHDHPASK